MMWISAGAVGSRTARAASQSMRLAIDASLRRILAKYVSLTLRRYGVWSRKAQKKRNKAEEREREI